MTSGGDEACPLTFYNVTKQIPKGVKRHCGMCRQHGVVAETRNHACPYKSCECRKCNLVRQRRSIMSLQIRLRREQDKKFVRTAEPDQAEVVPPKEVSDMTACYFCQKCKNHGILKWKKDHKKECQFTNCRCGQCDLIETRRALDSHIKRSKRQRRPVDDLPMASSGLSVTESVEASAAFPSATTNPVVNFPSPSSFCSSTSMSPSILDYSANGSTPNSEIDAKTEMNVSTLLLPTSSLLIQPSTTSSVTSSPPHLSDIQSKLLPQVPLTQQLLNEVALRVLLSQGLLSNAANAVASRLPSVHVQQTVLPNPSVAQQLTSLIVPQATITVSSTPQPVLTQLDIHNLVSNVQGIEKLLGNHSGTLL